MKLILSHRNHAPSESIVKMIESELTALLPELQIDEARVHLERSLTESPPYSASFHLVTPGPDIIVSSSDHTLRAAIIKAFQGIQKKIEHRQTKRTRGRDVPSAIELNRRRTSGVTRR